MKDRQTIGIIERTQVEIQAYLDTWFMAKMSFENNK